MKIMRSIHGHDNPHTTNHQPASLNLSILSSFSASKRPTERLSSLPLESANFSSSNESSSSKSRPFLSSAILGGSSSGSNNNNNNNNYNTTTITNPISPSEPTAKSINSANPSDIIPLYITKDDPKPAVFIARKLFSDFVQKVSGKIEPLLATDNQLPKDKPIFRCLDRHSDPIYDQILEALGSISEFCLPSLLELLIAWYHHQLDVDDHIQKRSISLNDGTHSLHQICELHHQSLDCGSTGSASAVPSNQTTTCTCVANLSASGNETTNLSCNPSLLIRSPTPSQQDSLSNQVSLISTSPLDYQPSATSLTIVSSSLADPHSSSAANTSTSTATNVSSNSLTEPESSTNTVKRLELLRLRKLLIEFAFCQCLIEIFNQLYLHPGYEDLIGQIEVLAFDHFRFNDANESSSGSSSANSANLGANYLAVSSQQLADKYAEVVGALARTRFKSVRKRFIAELSDLRSLEPTPKNIQRIVCLLSGMKYFRVKMAPIEEFEASFQFLQELAEYFLEVRHKSVRHALAGLFVEIMVPLASSVKNEVKIPCLKNFVDLLWSPTLEMCSRKKHSITLFPLVTCLLCLGQRSFFLANWSTFLNMCLSNLKNRDQKMCRVALDSLYRLIWIYMIRVKCESNNITQARLTTIVDALFPRGSRAIAPRDAPLSLFVDIIQFIAQERLDFAMRHIIFDLLSVDRPTKVIVAPERMNVALQAFLLIADNLQHKEGEPAMPKSLLLDSPKMSATSSADTRHQPQSTIRRACINKMLNDDTAKTIGLFPYYSHIQKSFNEILRTLDTQLGRPLMLTGLHGKDLDSADALVGGERRPKLELFKTCVAAIPRLMPDGMSKTDLIDLLSRMTVHVDEEMRKHAFESLQLLVNDFADWRLDAIEGFTSFLVNQIDESQRHLVDNALKMLLHFLVSWRDLITSSNNCGQTTGAAAAAAASGPACCASHRGNQRNSVVSIQTGYETISSRSAGTGGQIAARKSRALAEMRLIQSELSHTSFDRLIGVVQRVEAAALMMLCCCSQSTRKLASHLMRESRSIIKCYSSWICMEQFGFRSADEADEDDLSASLRGSLSADNLSRITALSASGPAHSSVTSINTQANLLSTSISKMCISGQLNHLNCLNQPQRSQAHQPHDLYDSEIGNNLAECLADESLDNSLMLFWFSVMLLESPKEEEYLLGLRLLSRILPQLPFERAEFMDELERNLKQMDWTDFPGLHTLVLRRFSSSNVAYELTIQLLDQLTPILRRPIASGAQGDNCFPLHVIVLLTHLLSNYDDPGADSLNIARRIAIWCDENGSQQSGHQQQRLENLATVMTLYSRRSFSKDAFQWTKCVVKYLHDAYAAHLGALVPQLLELLERGPGHVQRLIAPILYCMISYVEIGAREGGANAASAFNEHLGRLYGKCIGQAHWREAVQIFKLIISRSSYLSGGSNQRQELPGRTMDFSVDVDSIPVIGKTQLADLTAGDACGLAGDQQPQCLFADQAACVSPADVRLRPDEQDQQQPTEGAGEEPAGEPADGEQTRWRRSWLANKQVRARLVSLLSA